jgi:hypothetical protein
MTLATKQETHVTPICLLLSLMTATLNIFDGEISDQPQMPDGAYLSVRWIFRKRQNQRSSKVTKLRLLVNLFRCRLTTVFLKPCNRLLNPVLTPLLL